MQQATCRAPTNIAVIKYWGKSNVQLNIPLNSSVSVTLDPTDLQTVTTVVASRSFPRHRLWLNGSEEKINRRVETVISHMLALAQTTENVKKEDWPLYHFHIVSENSFPTAAGLASSASGYACLVGALAELLNCKETYPGQFSAIARQGSGSACRSLFGGFVKWQKGHQSDGADSLAVPLFPASHWEDLCCFICVVNDRKKETSSTQGMITSAQTSPLLSYRARMIVDERINQMEEAYKTKDFGKFGELMMKDSNQFHATCLDTYPPIFYLNETSKQLIHLVHKYNEYHDAIRAAYTFDAGPNAVIFVERANAAEFQSLLLHYFPAPWSRLLRPCLYVQGGARQPTSCALPLKLLEMVQLPSQRGLLQKIYATQVGRGIEILTDASLVDPETGCPQASSLSIMDRQETWMGAAVLGTLLLLVAFQSRR